MPPHDCSKVLSAACVDLTLTLRPSIAVRFPAFLAFALTLWVSVSRAGKALRKEARSLAAAFGP